MSWRDKSAILEEHYKIGYGTVRKYENTDKVRNLSNGQTSNFYQAEVFLFTQTRYFEK